MEDALVLAYLVFFVMTRIVLILVLMEDALVLSYIWNPFYFLLCLNPCFNGRCTRTVEIPRESVP